MCKQWFKHYTYTGKKKISNLEVDHISPVGYCGSIAEFVERLFVLRSELQLLCLDCHRNIKTPEDIKKMRRKNNEEKRGSETN
jgi:hypothetical protein